MFCIQINNLGITMFLIEVKDGLDRTKENTIEKSVTLSKKTRGLFQEIREITGKRKTNTGVLKSKVNKEEIEKDCMIKR